jgi:phage gp46-like protein
MDVALLFTPGTLQADISMDGTDLLVDREIESNIINSLFSDRRANTDDYVEGDDRRGWWADSFSEIPRDKHGSRLWLLNRAKQTTQTLALAKIYCLEALKWLVDDKVAKSVQVETEYVRQFVMGISINVTRPDGTVLRFGKYDYAWSQI